MRERIPAKGGLEQDVFSGWRRALCYTSKPGVCKKAKKRHNKRRRRLLRSQDEKLTNDLT